MAGYSNMYIFFLKLPAAGGGGLMIILYGNKISYETDSDTGL